MQSSSKAVRLTRRRFVAAGAAGSVAAAIGCKASNQAGWEFLTESQARTLGAICDQIVPADEFPSATQAGVLTYIDRQLVRHYRKFRDTYRDGLQQADHLCMKRFGKEPAALQGAQQTELAAAIEQQDRKFFDLVRTHTMEGYYGSPRHGGNRDAASWRMVGLSEPPARGRAQYDLKGGAAK